ncbi:MAG: guanylate kinase, partial [Solirubrobacterales bacterium]|nr:guanylate kinase [Solirubrobacterales bacterium]
GNRYGTLRSELDRRLGAGAAVVLEIEVQGARQVREAMPEAVAVFIAPPSDEALRARLIGRGTDTPEQVESRMLTAERELEAQPEFGHVVVNDRLEEATEQLAAIVRDELTAR